MRKRLYALLMFVWLGVGLVPGSRAAAPILLAPGVELILAGGQVATLGSSTATGVSALWSGVVTTLGAAVAYTALKDANGNAVRVPVSGETAAAPPSPSAPSTAQPTSTSCWSVGTECYTDPQAWAAAASADPSWNFYVISVNGNQLGYRVCPESSSPQGPSGCGGGATGSISGTTTSTCPSGYSVSNGNCVLTDPRAALSDQNIDIGRSGESYTYFNSDSDYSAAGVIKGNIDNNTFSVSGIDPFGNPTAYTVTAGPNGSTTIKQILQTTAPGGDSQITTKSVTLNSSGVVEAHSQQTTLGTVTVTDSATQTYTATPAAQGTVQTLPNDYAKENTLQETNNKLAQIKEELTKEYDPPNDPTAKSASEIAGQMFPGTFDALSSWQLPAHASICPTMTFDMFGQATVTVDAHCPIIIDNAPMIQTAMLLIWSMMAMFIVLRA